MISNQNTNKASRHALFNKITNKLKNEPTNRYIVLLFIFVLLIFLLPIWSFKYMPFQDNPNHLLSIHIINNIHNPNFDYAKYFKIDFSIFKPYELFFVVMIILTKIFPLLIAEKIFLTLYIILFALSFLLTVKIISKENIFISSIVLLFINNYFMFMGFYQFLLSIPIFFFALAYYVKNDGIKTTKQIFIFNILLALLFYSHIMSLGALLIVLFILDFIGNKKLKNSILLLLKVSPILVLTFYSIFFFSPASRFEPIYTIVISRLMDTTRFFYYNNNIDRSVFIIVVMLEFILLQKMIKNKPTLYEVRFLIAGFFLWLFSLIVPKSINYDSWYVNMRFIPFALLLPLFSFNKKVNSLTKHLFLIIILLMSIIGTISNYSFFRKENKIIESYLDGIKAIDRNPKILPLTIQTGERTQPLLTAWAYYNIEKGGVSPYSFAGINFYPLKYLHEHDQNFLPNPKEESPELLQSNMIDYYDYVFLTGRDKIIENVLENDSLKNVYSNDVIKIWKVKK